MLALGIVLTIFGVIMALIGNGMNNNMDTQIHSFIENGQINPGDVFLYLGIGLVILGVIFIIAGICRSAQKDNAPPWALYGSATDAQAFKCCRCGYTGFYRKTCPICKSKQTMLPYNGNTISSVRSEGQSGASVVKCPNCGAAVSSGNTFCGKCGSRIVGTQKCSKCGAEQTAGSAFCVNCGNKLNS